MTWNCSNSTYLQEPEAESSEAADYEAERNHRSLGRGGCQ